jgi:hypothetical protein
MVFLIPLLLQAASPAAAPPVQLAANESAKPADKDDPNKKICKREPRTGSLAGVERICRTKAQWQALSDRTRDEWQEIQGAKGSTLGG